MREGKLGQAANVMLFVAASSDHFTPKTGATLAVSLSKDGSAFSPIAPVVTERGFGWYAVALTAAHTDTEGDLIVRATAANADPAERCLVVYSTKAADAVRVGGALQSPGDIAALGAGLLNAVNLYGSFGPINRYLSAVGLDPAGFWLSLNLPLTPQQRLTVAAVGVDAPEVGGSSTPLGLLTGDAFENSFAIDPSFTGPVSVNSRLLFTLENPGVIPFPGATLQLVAASSFFGASPKNWLFALPASPAGRTTRYRALADGTLICADGAPDLVFGGRQSLILGG